MLLPKIKKYHVFYKTIAVLEEELPNVIINHWNGAWMQ